MAKPPTHPAEDAIDLSAVLDALSDPLRRAIVRRLAESGETRCATFLEAHATTKTNLSYHINRLREAGVLHLRAEGPYRFATLRAEALERRFPGLLGAIVAAAREEPPVVLCGAQPGLAPAAKAGD